MDVKDMLGWTRDSLAFLPAELTLLTSLAVVLVVGFINRSSLRAITAIAFVLSIVLNVINWPQNSVALFGGMLQSDQYTSFLELLLCGSGLLTVLMPTPAARNNTAEYFVMILAVVVGGCFTILSDNLLAAMLGMELTSIAAYVLAGQRLTKASAEGSLKYFLFGSVVTAVTLFGMSFLYGLTGTLDFTSAEFASHLQERALALAGVGSVMVIAGFLFKMTCAPFHFWAPDVYEASPTPVVALVSVVPKLAGFGILVKFSLAIHLFGQSRIDWQAILGWIAVLTIAAGSLPALWQTHVRRLMAYSSVAQAGFLLVGVTTFTLNGLQAALFYATVFVVANFLVFALLNDWEQNQGVHTLADLAKAGSRTVFGGVLMTLGMISLTGIPPVAGFTAKLLVFSTAFDTFQESGKEVFLWLMVTGLIATVLSLFFYLKIPYYIFLKEGLPSTNEARPAFTPGNSLAMVLAIVLVLLFLRPAFLMGWLFRINFAL